MTDYGIKVGMLILLQPDIEKAVEFYDKMGFKKRFHIKGQWAEFSVGDVKIGLCPTAQELPEHHTGIVLEIKELKKAYDQLKKEGVHFMNGPQAPEHGIMVSFRDPGNNIMDLYQPTPEKVEEVIDKIKRESQEISSEIDDECCGSNRPGSCSDCRCSDECNCVN